jgi:hypothetical protein
MHHSFCLLIFVLAFSTPTTFASQDIFELVIDGIPHINQQQLEQLCTELQDRKSTLRTLKVKFGCEDNKSRCFEEEKNNGGDIIGKLISSLGSSVITSLSIGNYGKYAKKAPIFKANDCFVLFTELQENTQLQRLALKGAEPPHQAFTGALRDLLEKNVALTSLHFQFTKVNLTIVEALLYVVKNSSKRYSLKIAPEAGRVTIKRMQE